MSHCPPQGMRALALVDDAVTEPQLLAMAAAVDTDGNGRISWEEFLRAFELGVRASSPLTMYCVKGGRGGGDGSVGGGG